MCLCSRSTWNYHTRFNHILIGFFKINKNTTIKHILQLQNIHSFCRLVSNILWLKTNSEIFLNLKMKVIKIIIVQVILILNILDYNLTYGLSPRTLHCIDQTSTECYIVNSVLHKNDSFFKPVSVDPMNVMTLKFESSAIPHITSEICKAFPNLRSINAMKSMIEVVDEDAFHECTNLDFIDFGHNKIQKLEKDTFNKNTKLRTISLHNNNLESLDNDLFMNLPNLKRLVLSLNDLTEVPVIIFRDLVNLRELTLHHNRLTDLDAEQLVKYCPNLAMIHLRDNDFRCERLQKILNVFNEAKVSFWDYADKLRPRNYTVEFIDRMECLNDVQYDMEMQIRKNFSRTIFDIEKELNQLKIDVSEVRKEEEDSSHNILYLAGLATFLVFGVIVGYIIAKRKRRNRESPMERLNERMGIVGTDFSHS